MKYRKVMESTDNSGVYKKAKHRLLSIEEGRCFICGPYRGCNRGRSKIERNWKEYRKTQWKQ